MHVFRWMGTLLAATWSVIGAADQRTGRVVGITDGDRLTVLIDRTPIKVRLAEIDTPEKGQPWANRAKQAVSGKVFGQVVELQVVDIDRYGRTVAKVFRDGRDINREMVRGGECLNVREVSAGWRNAYLLAVAPRPRRSVADSGASRPQRRGPPSRGGSDE